MNFRFASIRAKNYILNILSCGHQLSLPVVDCRYGSVAVFGKDGDFKRVIHPNSEDVTMIELCTNHLFAIYESHVFATSIPDEQLIPDLYYETMIAGDPRIINHYVIVLCTSDKSYIPISESVLSHGEILVFQFKSKHGAPPTDITWPKMVEMQSLCPLLSEKGNMEGWEWTVDYIP